MSESSEDIPTNRPASAHQHPWKISDVVIFPLLAMGFAAKWVWTTTLYLWRLAGIVLGLGLLSFGFWLINRSKRELDDASQPSLPGEPTTRLIVSGPFSWSRNPNYLGAALMGLGGAIAFDSIWLVATTLVSSAILEFWMIRPEERYLAARFAGQYEEYRKHTRRWL